MTDQPQGYAVHTQEGSVVVTRDAAEITVSIAAQGTGAYVVLSLEDARRVAAAIEGLT